ncbi:MAG: hypothetical protein ABH919_03625 [bacterium]
MDLNERRKLIMNFGCRLRNTQDKIEELREIMSKIETYGVSFNVAAKELQKFIKKTAKEPCDKEAKTIILKIANNFLDEIQAAQNNTALNDFVKSPIKISA